MTVEVKVVLVVPIHMALKRISLIRKFIIVIMSRVKNQLKT